MFGSNVLSCHIASFAFVLELHELHFSYVSFRAWCVCYIRDSAIHMSIRDGGFHVNNRDAVMFFSCEQSRPTMNTAGRCFILAHRSRSSWNAQAAQCVPGDRYFCSEPTSCCVERKTASLKIEMAIYYLCVLMLRTTSGRILTKRTELSLMNESATLLFETSAKSLSKIFTHPVLHKWVSQQIQSLIRNWFSDDIGRSGICQLWTSQ